MTRVIFHGGYGGHWDNAGTDLPLFKRLIAAAEQADQKVMISFLSAESLAKFPFIDEVRRQFHALNPDIKLTIADRANFREQLSQHQVLFLQGGNSLAHHEFLSTFTAEEISKGKVLLGGSSSGAMLLSQFGYTASGEQIIKGKGIVDIAVIPHADNKDWAIDNYMRDLRAVTKLPILLINENEIVELNIY